MPPALPRRRAARARPGRATASARRPGAALALGLLALAATIALLAPGRLDGTPGDAAAEGIARAERCGEPLRERAAWQRCIDAQLAALRADPLAAAGVRFHAWRVADRAAGGGHPEAAALRDAYARRLADDLRSNRLTLHRLCTAAGEPCEPIASRLDAPA
ncbi:MAG TPA: hypothetical protein VEA81_01650 [Burkholderiaceae bacterium]|nr:hypothetical protein [Burkholderiaceae bacterium]